MTVLPAFELGDLARPLLAADLSDLAGELELLALKLQGLTLDFQRLVLQVHQQMEQGDGIVEVGDDLRGPLAGRGNFHPIRPVGRRRILA